MNEAAWQRAKKSPSSLAVTKEIKVEQIKSSKDSSVSFTRFCFAAFILQVCRFESSVSVLESVYTIFITR